MPTKESPREHNMMPLSDAHHSPLPASITNIRPSPQSRQAEGVPPSAQQVGLPARPPLIVL